MSVQELFNEVDEINDKIKFTTKDLMAKKEEINAEIESRVNEFLKLVHAAGSFAPTVTHAFGGGTDSIESIDMQDDCIVLSCSNVFRCNTDYYSVSYPLALFDNPSTEAIQAHFKAIKDAEDLEKARKQAVELEKRRESDLRTLNSLKAKYPDA